MPVEDTFGTDAHGLMSTLPEVGVCRGSQRSNDPSTATHPRRHVSRLYERVKRRRGHQKAIGAVGRHPAEATYWMLKKQEPYRDPGLKQEVESKREA